MVRSLRARRRANETTDARASVTVAMLVGWFVGTRKRAIQIL
jgi:pantothenate kinase-related protein Tda10